jgi:DNA (cytosine-5)-methyltransferase 1
VTATPGLSRPAQLTALGNGVVPQQAAHALRLLAPHFPRCHRCVRP